VICPFVLGYGGGDPIVSDIVVGILVVTLSLVRVTAGHWQSWLSWTNMLLGIWVFASVFWLADSAAASWNEAVVGAAITVLSVLSASATGAARRATRH
jgi:hypothetical protein